VGALSHASGRLEAPQEVTGSNPAPLNVLSDFEDPANPHLVSADLRRYLRCRIAHDLWTTQVRAFDRISAPDYRVWTSRTLVTDPRRPGIEIA
jgi:hypothetical protein